MKDPEHSPRGEGSPLTRRRMLGLSTMAAWLAAAGMAGCDPGGVGAGGAGGATGSGSPPGPGGSTASPVPAAAPIGALGANVNQDLEATNFAELRAVSATWLRGFYPMQNVDQGDVANQPGMRKLTEAIEQGYGTVLNLKFAYDQGLPAAGSGAMDLALKRLEKVLTVVMGKVDILVIGNEPFYECSQRDRATAVINEFYETVAQSAVTYRQRHAGSGRTQIYLGALTALDNPPRDELPQIDRWLQFAKNDRSIAGTDCHPHVASLRDAQRYVNYILPRLRPDQKFLATEFSLVKLFRNHLTDPVPTKFADRYGISRGALVWEVVHDAIEHPFPQNQWNDFLSSCTWFADHKDFMSNVMRAFRNTERCAVATYGLTQDSPMVSDFGPDKTPWVFNSLFCPQTTRQAADGLPGQNVTWTDQFRSLQHA